MIRAMLLATALCCIATPIRSQGKTTIEPLLSLGFESEGESHEPFTLVGKDSVVSGIEGEARYFSGAAGHHNHILIQTDARLSSLWRDRDFSIEVWVQTTAANDQFQVSFPALFVG